MAKSRKGGGRRPRRRYKRGGGSPGRIFALSLVLIAAVALGLYALYVSGDRPAGQAPGTARTEPVKKSPVKQPVKEARKKPAEEATKPPKKPGEKPGAVKAEAPVPTAGPEPGGEKKAESRDKKAVHDGGIRPRVAIIVDDIGQHKEPIDRLLKLEGPLTFAILPNLPYSKYAAEKAHARGWDVILHLPMEPMESSGYTGQDAGEDALLVGQSKEAILAQLDKNLASFPNIEGVNNHMGSKFMENDELMELVLERINSRGLYFVDSLTTPRSVGYKKAAHMGMRTVKRDVFLDLSSKGPDYVKSQLDRLVKISEKNGHAVGICHPYGATIEALTEYMPVLEKEVEMSNASDVVSRRKEVSER
ncbi:MAG TPA: divergent polysaccharide deacetylase family protein [Thermodesulfobacteriota bacterium]|nr:divergent polysaccharide deacetylase family protein [Thermodesulfobacteriota bacterium]